MTAEAIVDRLTLINRAYQAHYMLGGKTDDYLTDSQIEAYIDAAGFALDDCASTDIEITLKLKCSPAMLSYIATGKVDCYGSR
jgi:hypothetical protein